MKIIFEDDYLLVIDKPPGLVVDKSKTQKEDTLEDLLRIDLERSGIVHRLDKDTSGVLLVAKTQETLDNLQLQFKERKVKKEYLVLVHGFINKAGRVEGAVGRNPGNREKFSVLPIGKQAITEYEPVKNFKFPIVFQTAFGGTNFKSIFADFNKIQMRKLEKMKYNQFTLLTCQPKTGRTHQIRVHLKYIGNPIVSDEKYVGRKMYRLDKRWCPRMFLHAKKLGFYHPVFGEWIEVESELPEDLRKVLWKAFLYNLL